VGYPFEHILLATEHSEFDIGAERVAFELAHRHSLLLAGVFPIISNSEYETIAPQLVARTEREAAEKLAALRATAASMGVRFDIRARRGEEPYREILNEAKERHADLIVTRRRGKRGFLANLLIGEMVSKVAANAPCSVLMVPRAGQMWSRSVLAAVDESAGADRVTSVAAAVAAQYSLPLVVVCVAASDVPKLRQRAGEAVDRAIDSAHKLGASARGRVMVGKPFEQILQAVSTEGADLIVVGGRADTSIKRALLGGTAQKVIGLAEVPVLVTHC
jgi:nucleotide-binding universal stress UspA family protein